MRRCSPLAIIGRNIGTLYFTRSELNQLLGLYSRHVARGVWRDYAIDHRDGMALFSVFRHTHEAPAYSIVKTAPAPARPAEFIVQSRAAEAARRCQSRRRAGVLSDAAQPRRRGDRLAGYRPISRQHSLDYPVALDGAVKSARLQGEALRTGRADTARQDGSRSRSATAGRPRVAAAGIETNPKRLTAWPAAAAFR